MSPSIEFHDLFSTLPFLSEVSSAVTESVYGRIWISHERGKEGKEATNRWNRDRPWSERSSL
jgi:hypothetical protein